MELASTIRSCIEDYIKGNGYKLQQFATICGINVGTLSAIINGSRLIAVNQLDKITSSMGLNKGHFYEMYSIECFIESTPHWRRIEPFLYQCAELNKLDCIKKVIISVTDDRAYIEELFEVAEDLYNKGMKQAALILYECVAECEKYQHSERLALCQYRIFLINIGHDQKVNRLLISKLEPFIERLDEDYQLDAIKDLANAYWGLHEWDSMRDLACQLEKKSDIAMRQNKKRISETQYPLYVYKTYSNLLIANYHDYSENYKEALRYTDLYEGILEDFGDHNNLIDRKIRDWAKVNKYLYQVMMGVREIIPEYITCIEKDEAEILPALVKVFQSANRHQYDVDDLLIKFEKEISTQFSDAYLRGGYTEQSWYYRRVVLFYEIAVYYFKRHRHESGAKSLLISLELSIFVKDDAATLKCINLYGEFKSHLSKETESRYKALTSLLHQNASL
ncbi:transcriptional regulator [Paenibacillus sp.]|uniref:transcriptional regulator n=2 Tax=Paenibacillus TaxID=44249 RepID=UPI00117F77EB|nr:transcriptional regulator [Paenibacillus sp.]